MKYSEKKVSQYILAFRGKDDITTNYVKLILEKMQAFIVLNSPLSYISNFTQIYPKYI